MKFSLFNVILLVWMCVGESGDGRPGCGCHTVTNTRIPVERIVDYHIPSTLDMCSSRVVIFVTRRYRMICSDLDASWAKEAIEVLNRKRRKMIDPEDSWAKKAINEVNGRRTLTEEPSEEPTANLITTTTAIQRTGTEGKRTGEGPSPVCCLTVTNTRIPVQYIEDYTIQESTGLCAIRAIRFLTRKGKYICSDPDDSWAIRAINDVNKRKNKGPSVEPTMCLTSTTNMIPTTTTTTTHETPRLKTETSSTTTHDHPDCCLTVTNTRTPAEDIVDYHIQDSSLCPIRAVRFITVENSTICSSPAEDWVQDYIQILNKTKTTTDTLQLDVLSEEEKQTKSSSSEINDPYTNNNEYFCLKKEPVQYFCIKQP